MKTLNINPVIRERGKVPPSGEPRALDEPSGERLQARPRHAQGTHQSLVFFSGGKFIKSVEEEYEVMKDGREYHGGGEEYSVKFFFF